MYFFPFFIYLLFYDDDDDNEQHREACMADWISLLSDRGFLFRKLPGWATVADAVSFIEFASCHSTPESLLILVLCGHGSSGGGLSFTDGTSMSCEDVVKLTQGYRGTVISVMIYCGAMPSHANNPTRAIHTSSVPSQRLFFIFGSDKHTLAAESVNKLMKGMADVLGSCTHTFSCTYGNVHKRLQRYLPNSNVTNHLFSMLKMFSMALLRLPRQALGLVKAEQ